MNLANKLTLLRIILVPVFLVFIGVRGIPYGRGIATLIFIIASLTDKLDGYIARSRNQITRFGKIMDPLADKLLVSAALVSLVEFRTIPAWVAVVIIAREFAVTGLRSVAAAEGLVIAASWWGKLKTVIQIIAILFALLSLDIRLRVFRELFGIKLNEALTILTFLTNITMFAAVIITIISGVDYFVKNKYVLKADK
ncbi:MAG: CDP-diacylglycerol--glycerol-3-phosphate 3-phosphatidyltransferase [Bacillota bacterium]|nr:CDP-diacylglycerol--glycerol-3-phosphate 3-phosphatidyltransferase [Bacillota bacterium]